MVSGRGRRYNREVIEALDLATAAEADLRALYALDMAIEEEAAVEDERKPWETFLVEARNPPAIRPSWRWVAWDEERKRMLGTVEFAFWDEPSNRNQAQVWVQVHPDARRRRLATQLVAQVLPVAASEGRTLLNIGTRGHLPSGPPFAERLGATKKFSGRHNVMDLTRLDRGLLEGWIAQAAERAADYRLEGWDGPCPDDRLEAFVGVQAVMNTAPFEGLEREDDVFTAGILRQRERDWASHEQDWWTLVAVHRPTDQLVGLNELVFPRTWPTRVYQHDTGVDPAHRNKGLGRWLKAANLLRVLDERPEARSVVTGNAGSNEPMLNINHALGFRRVDEWAIAQVSLDVVERSLKEMLP